MFIKLIVLLRNMKISRKQIEASLFIAVYLFAIYLWTLPFQDNRIPYGEFDAISHWELGDFIAQRDRTFVSLPPFLDYSYGNDNKFVPHTLWYHPPFHTDLAIISAFAQDRVVPIYLTNAVFATAILISVFFVIRKLFGFLPAILSALLLTFSMRNIMPYLWGQWPERFGYAFIPLILYAFYKYYTSYSKESSKPIYLYLMVLFLGVELMIHPLSFFHSLVGLFVLGIALLIKLKKIPFNAKHIAIAAVIFGVLFAIFPYQSGNVVVSFTQDSKRDNEYPSLSRLFQWAPNAEDFRGSVPENYFSFRDMHGLWTLPFLLLGLLILIVRRENRDVFLLAWLISLYLILHRDFIGKFTFLHRSLSATAHIFVPITVIGALSISSFIPLAKKYKSYIKYGLVILVVALVFKFNYPLAHSTLDSAYDSPIIRLNPAQIEVSEWLLENLDEDENVSIAGPPSQIMQKVWWMASFSHKTSFFFEGFLTWKTFEENREETVSYHLLNDYVVMDYSDIALLSDRSFVESWSEFEQQNLGGHNLVYNKDNIRVYKYEAS
jgi:hypothetical protein